MLEDNSEIRDARGEIRRTEMVEERLDGQEKVGNWKARNGAVCTKVS